MIGWPHFVQAQNIIEIGEDFSGEAQAVLESVPKRERPEYNPIGIRLGQLLNLSDERFTSKITSDGKLTPLPTGADPEKTKLTARDSALDSFILSPSLEVEYFHDDNLFRTDLDAAEDNVMILRPNLAVNSDWLNHAVFFEIGGEIGRHQDFDGEDYSDYFLALGTLLDVDENTTLDMRLEYSIWPAMKKVVQFE